MLPLPAVAYETGEWVGSRKVANDCHVGGCLIVCVWGCWVKGYYDGDLV
ncbi:hypothetical protein BHAP_0678 [Bifidobacterium hapali]|uniref:Uncharacterized protein n=1 Tax=Bifidobacterium hapali TaxID=1630172 RepID=A0A261G1V8_9BIFI|nr:hypothetical protein BHAP_0678 [Bifidobacterium hapali]